MLNKDYEIINLATDIWVFLGAIESLKEQVDKEMMFKSYLLSQVTSYCINEDSRNFKSEYVISQLITLACKSNKIDGISYISKRVSTNEFGHNICMNLALFIPYEQDVKYSQNMISEMKIGTPINYAYFNKLKRAPLNLSIEPLPYELKQGAIAIGDFENQIPYTETDFYDYDRYLRQITLKKIWNRGFIMIENNKNTIMAMEKISNELSPTDWEDYLFDSTEYAMELDSRNPVLEGIVERLNQLGIQITCEDKKVIIKELNKRYIAMGIEEGAPRAVKNWISGTPVNPAYRENLYNLCIALGMNTEQVRVFFLKNYMTIPFNYKDRIDAIYFYGISHDLPYLEILKLLNENELEEDSNSDFFESTKMIGNYIAEIDDIEIFREYLRSNSYGKRKQYETASRSILELSVENAGYAEIERTLNIGLRRERENKKGDLLSESTILKDDKTVNFKALLFVVYGYDNQERYANKKTKISKCEYLPKAFRENFPNDQEFSRILKREASPDVYRKALVIMKFYNFFCSSMITYMYGTDKPEVNQKPKKVWEDYYERDTDEIVADLNDFYYETGLLLSQCGFEQMYARNPFDWLMLYCAMSNNPMDTFRELLMSRFTEMEPMDEL